MENPYKYQDPTEEAVPLKMGGYKRSLLPEDKQELKLMQQRGLYFWVQWERSFRVSPCYRTIEEALVCKISDAVFTERRKFVPPHHLYLRTPEDFVHRLRYYFDIDYYYDQDTPIINSICKLPVDYRIIGSEKSATSWNPIGYRIEIEPIGVNVPRVYRVQSIPLHPQGLIGFRIRVAYLHISKWFLYL